MLNLEKQMKISRYSGLYDDIIPADNLLRKIKEHIDFSFINPLMQGQYCEAFGRPAYEPEIMFKALFLEILYGLSDREFEQRAMTDMAFKFFLELEPEDKIPDHSLLCKFRKTRISEDMLEGFLSETIRQALEKKLIKSTAIIVDSTHSKSKHLQQTPTQILREMTKELRKEIYRTQHILSEKFPEKPEIQDAIEDEIAYTKALVSALSASEIKSLKAQKQLKKIRETLELPNLLELQSGTESDAKIGHKSQNDAFFGFKNHLAITENEQLITGLVVTSGNDSDTPQFEELVGQSLENGVEVNEILGDKSYSSAAILEFAEARDIKIISKLPENVGTCKVSDQYVHFCKDAGTFECCMGNLAFRSKRSGTKGKTSGIEYYFSKVKCRNCPHQKKCVTSKKGEYKRIWLSGNEIHSKQKEFQDTDYFKERYRRRPIIEGKNADLKGNYGLGRTRGTGLRSMKIQAFLTAFTANVVKITRLATA
jgi:IS5 family transposase